MAIKISGTTVISDDRELQNITNLDQLAFAPNANSVVVTAATFSTTSTVWTPVTGLSVTISPSSNTRNILLFISLSYGISTNQAWGLRLTRNGSEITQAVGDSAGARQRVFSELIISASSAPLYLRNAHFSYLDSPATTSPIVYGVDVIALPRSSSAGTFYLNRSSTDANSSEWARGVSSISVLEVK